MAKALPALPSQSPALDGHHRERQGIDDGPRYTNLLGVSREYGYTYICICTYIYIYRYLNKGHSIGIIFPYAVLRTENQYEKAGLGLKALPNPKPNPMGRGVTYFFRKKLTVGKRLIGKDNVMSKVGHPSNQEKRAPTFISFG